MKRFSYKGRFNHNVIITVSEKMDYFSVEVEDCDIFDEWSDEGNPISYKEMYGISLDHSDYHMNVMADHINNNVVYRTWEDIAKEAMIRQDIEDAWNAFKKEYVEV